MISQECWHLLALVAYSLKPEMKMKVINNSYLYLFLYLYLCLQFNLYLYFVFIFISIFIVLHCSLIFSARSLYGLIKFSILA